SDGFERVAGAAGVKLREALARLPASSTADELVQFINGSWPNGDVATERGKGVKATLADVTWLLANFPKEAGLEAFVSRHRALQKLTTQAFAQADAHGGLHPVARAV